MGGRFARAHGSSRCSSPPHKPEGLCGPSSSILRVATCSIKNVHPFWERTVIFGGGAENRTPVQSTFLVGFSKLSCQLGFGSVAPGDPRFAP